MLKREEIDQFYKDVLQIGLKFPVAAIADATGHSKGNVSKYLSRKLEPSEAFLKAYYEKFPKDSKNVSRETIAEPETEYGSGDKTSQLLETINLLVKQNDKLADTNRILAEKISTIPVGAGSGIDEGWDSFRLAAMDFLFEVAAGKRYKSVDEANNIFRNKLSDEVRAKKKKGIHV